jgi:hypothetical protein
MYVIVDQGDLNVTWTEFLVAILVAIIVVVQGLIILQKVWKEGC